MMITTFEIAIKVIRMNKENSEQLYWYTKQNQITTDMGMWVGGDDVKIRQYSLFKDLFGKVSYMQLIVLNITGRLITKSLSQWLENNFLCMSYPDARIWCNQVGAFSGVKKTSVTAATASGVLAADSRAYGGSQTTKIAMTYIQSTLKVYEQKSLSINKSYTENHIIKEIVESSPVKHSKPAIVGFVRPVDKADERIKPHIQMTKDLGFDTGPHMSLALKISEYLLNNYNSGINIGGYTAAFLSDQHFSPEEGYRIKNSCVASGVTASYIDNLQHDNNEFLPLGCSDINYEGKKIRNL